MAPVMLICLGYPQLTHSLVSMPIEWWSWLLLPHLPLPILLVSQRVYASVMDQFKPQQEVELAVV